MIKTFRITQVSNSNVPFWPDDLKWKPPDKHLTHITVINRQDENPSLTFTLEADEEDMPTEEEVERWVCDRNDSVYVTDITPKPSSHLEHMQRCLRQGNCHLRLGRIYMSIADTMGRLSTSLELEPGNTARHIDLRGCIDDFKEQAKAIEEEITNGSE